MQPISSAVPVDTYTAPLVNASYRRANGEAPLSSSRASDSQLPYVPALVRPQLQFFSENDIRALELRMEYQAQDAARSQRIDARASRVSAEAHAAAEQRSAMLRQRAARHAKAAGEVRVKKIQEDYRSMGM
ncbi:hypothetical protein conserved [Leishmania donovani]|uniref:Uncharacterized protein n=3 Tax=Leishmania donovani species complex TaxID=38574 RepID=A4I0K8_LEIIN|nr:conserved hypothetical protein [Leishmania infantum JPCM5]XP_003861068.1 hypothetical protein, conserved [Leishmania donovani]CAC9490263.1 hypothetical_protein_-_conserved [Leishmania infantum]AYU79059.1 hypothetical protein LdCL_230024700 [Leishmania donovani]TPP50191.1 hypothetical protein CGC21_16870 [Leishmania donovani]TPP51259.1 hypothetical protein CGC20_17755 [Leishmania donovani]CAJ1989052.1 hypothetical protein conserved [Leishmania donovani]|eukprot:XP_001465849.1 conserved hypothetical protein [Leishmania infantum JPCM5]